MNPQSNDTQSTAPSEREEIETLLPWYVTGKLDDAEAKRVAAYLARHPDMAERARLARAERNETVHLAGLAEDYPPVDADRFMAKIAATRHGSEPESGGLMAWINDLVSVPFGSGMRWAGAAAVIVIMVQAAALFTVLVPRIVNDYEMAEGTKPAALSGTFVLVRFADDASVSDIAKMLSDLKMTIADGPKAGNLFSVRIGPESLGAEERKSRSDALAARKDMVVFVTATK